MPETKSPLNKVGWALLTIFALLIIALFFLVEKESKNELTLPETEEATTPRPLAEGWYRFADPDGEFTINYPLIATTITDKQSMNEVGYIPTCNSETGVVCIYLPAKTYPETNFQGAGVSINKTAIDNPIECREKTENEQETEGSQMIGGITFERFFAGDAAMSHQSSGFNYRAWHGDTCYEITTRLNTTSFEVYEEGSITRFTEEDRTTVLRILDEVVKTFAFSA